MVDGERSLISSESNYEGFNPDYMLWMFEIFKVNTPGTMTAPNTISYIYTISYIVYGSYIIYRVGYIYSGGVRAHPYISRGIATDRYCILHIYISYSHCIYIYYDIRMLNK